MAPPFSLRFVTTAPNLPPIVLVNQESSGLIIKSPAGQRLWDLSQSALRSLPSNGLTPATFFLRLSTATRDHGRTFCTVRVPSQDRKFQYKFFFGIGEWVLTAPLIPPPPGIPSPSLEGSIVDGFYGRRLAYIDYRVLWGLDGLLGATWHNDHARVCSVKHWDVLINVAPADPGGGLDPRSALRGRFTAMRVCADAKVEALFQSLIGYERSTRWESLAHCLTEVVDPCGEARLGRCWSFEEVRLGNVKMWQTGWFEKGECVALVASVKRAAFLRGGGV